MLSIMPNLRSWIWSQWQAYYECEDPQINPWKALRRSMDDSKAERLVFGGIADGLLGGPVMPTITLEGQRRTI